MPALISGLFFAIFIMNQDNRKNFENYLIALQKAFIEHAAKSPQLGTMVTQYTSILNDPYTIVNADSAIKKYINFYNVLPNDDVYDEFKLIYFLSKEITNKLDSAGLADISKTHQRATLKLLEYRLKSPYAANRVQLTHRIELAINHNKVNEHFGEYGLYILHKCLFNAARDNAQRKSEAQNGTVSWS